MKIDRKQVHAMFNGHCAYCGKEIDIKQLRVDHIKPIFRNQKPDKDKWWQIDHGKMEHPENDNQDNLFPSCARCNTWKSTWSVEQFREQIALQIERLEMYHNGFRMSIDFGLLTKTENKVVFYFEKHTK